MPKFLHRILLLLAFSLLFTTQEAQAKVLLVSVGIGDYPKPINKLNLPTKDAIAMQKLIDKNGDSGTALLLDAAATKSAIIAEIHARLDHASTDDIIIFFFSGHGYKGGFVAYDGEIPYSMIRKAMSASKCKNKMIFADACFSGKMRQGKREVKEEHSDSNVMLFLSSRDNETSIERRDMANGFFTTCLKDGMSGKADANRDRIITAKELFDFVSKNVKFLSRNKQHPVMWGNFSNTMPVIQW